MGLCFCCFDGGNKQMTKEEERLASEEARARAAEAAQKKQEQLANSPSVKAADAEQEGTTLAKQASNSNKEGSPKSDR